MPTLKTQEEVVEQLTLKYLGHYDFSKVVYKGNKVKVEVVCNTCETEFWKTPDKLIAGEGCKVCSLKGRSQKRSSTTALFVKSAKDLNGEGYDYSKVDYVNNHTKVDIKCNRCQTLFSVQPKNHLTGRGCPSCAKTGYKRDRSGNLYIMKCGDITKVGITNLDITIRVKDISRSFGSAFTVQTTWSFLNGALADDIETSILRLLRTKYERPQAKFEGSSECFLNVDYEELVNLINKEIENLSETTL